MPRRRAVSMIELIVVLCIIGVFLALLLPAVQAVRERARETVCKNNIYQINLGIIQYWETHKRLPARNAPDRAGGWIVDILPFIEQRNFKEFVTIGMPISEAKESLHSPPPIFRCPKRSLLDRTPPDAITPSHYVFAPSRGRQTYSLFDSPITLSQPWLSGPEMRGGDVAKSIGPHSKGFFYVGGFQNGVSFIEHEGGL